MMLQSIKERDRKAYELALKFITTVDIRITPEIVHQQINESEYSLPDDMPTIFHRLIQSACNAQMKLNVIGNIDDLKDTLCEYNPSAVLEKYHGDKDLLDYIVNYTKSQSHLRVEKKSIWPGYCRSIIDGASFLVRFESAKQFHSFVSFFHESPIALPALPLLISKEIYGFGFALACDFLKEIGYKNYAKPDVHLKNILFNLNLSDSPNDFDVFRAIIRIANNCNTSAYAIDKLFWLIGSGKFNSSKIEIGGHALEFIEWCRPRLL